MLKTPRRTLRLRVVSCTRGIPARFCAKPLGDPPRAAPLFSSDQSWQMWKKGQLRVIRYHPPTHPSAFWEARFAWPVRALTVRFDPTRTRLESDVFRYPLDFLVTLYTLASRQGLIIHGAAIVAHKKCWVLAGASGAGKSTLCRLILQNVPEAKAINDDRVILRRIRRRWYAFGAPWSGTAGIAKTRSARLGGILLLQQSRVPQIVPLGVGEAMKGLAPLISIPWYDRPVVERLLPVSDRLVRETPVARFDFPPTRDAARFLVRSLSALANSSRGSA